MQVANREIVRRNAIVKIVQSVNSLGIHVFYIFWQYWPHWGNLLVVHWWDSFERPENIKYLYVIYMNIVHQSLIFYYSLCACLFTIIFAVKMYRLIFLFLFQLYISFEPSKHDEACFLTTEFLQGFFTGFTGMPIAHLRYGLVFMLPSFFFAVILVLRSNGYFRT